MNESAFTLDDILSFKKIFDSDNSNVKSIRKRLLNRKKSLIFIKNKTFNKNHEQNSNI